MRAASLGIALALTSAAPSVLAEAETVRLDYAAVRDVCPPRADFEAEVRARTSKVAFGDSGRYFRVQIERGEAGFVGTLAISEQAAAESERRIDGTDCAEVASALALVAALAVDPDAKTGPRAELALAPSVEPEVEPKPEPEPEPTPSASAAPRPVQERAPSPRPPSQPSPRWGWAVALGASALSGPAPRWLFAVGPEAELLRRTGASVQSLGLSVFAAQTGIVGPSDDRSRFRLLALRVSVCPVGADAGWRWRACAVADGGALSAEGRGVDQSMSKTRPWLAAGLRGRLGLALSSRIYVDLDLIGEANLTRDHFIFQNPKRTVYDVPFASFAGGLTAGASFP